MSRRRLALGLGIVLFWGTMTALLVRREALVPRWERQATASAPSETWLGVFSAAGERVGHVHVATRPEARAGEAGTRTELATRLALKLLGRDTELELDGEVWRPEAGRRAELRFDVRSGGQAIAVEGRLGDGALDVEVTTGGERLPIRVPVDDELVLTGGFGSAVELPWLEVGEEVKVASFDPLTLSRGELRLKAMAHETREVAGERIETQLLAVESGGVRTRAWIDRRGELVRAETPFGLVLERIAPEALAGPPGVAGGGEILDLVAIRPSGRRPVRGARELTLALGGRDLPPPPLGELQQDAGSGRLRLVASTPPAAGAVAALEDGPFLVADPFVQAEHPEIRAAAASIVGDEGDLWRRALAIHDWVHRELEKEPVMSVPSALEVLRARRGDCNEHTVLFAALARAAGVPTRIAVGVVWSDELEGFYYHAWPEVHLGRWIAMDPTLGQPLADATHLKLVEGGIESWPRLLPWLGTLEIRVLEVLASPAAQPSRPLPAGVGAGSTTEGTSWKRPR